MKRVATKSFKRVGEQRQCPVYAERRTNMRLNTVVRVLVLTAATFLHSAPGAQAADFKLDPRGTFLRTNADPGALPSFVISLQQLGFVPGDLIRLQRFGDWDADLGNNFQDNIRSMIGVFSASNVLLPADQLHRVRDAIDAGVDDVTEATFFGGLLTDIPEDFRITDTVIEIPPGATHLFIAARDRFYQDNRDPDGDFGVRITRAPRLALPVIFVHGTCSQSGTWTTMKNALIARGWTFGGTLSPSTNDLPSHPSDADFYLINFIDPVIGNGIENWGLELKRYLDAIQSFRLAHGRPKTQFIIVAHSAGGLAARVYLQSLVPARPYTNDIHHLITYGTPHSGTPGAASSLAQRYLATVGECSIFTPQQIESSLGIQEMNPNSLFLHSLNDQLFPAGVQHTSLIGIESDHVCRFVLAGEDDCVVPATSQNIRNIHAPPLTSA